MQYKTITLELINERPHLQQALVSNDSLLLAMETLAVHLRNLHHEQIEALKGSDPMQSLPQIRARAMETAIIFLQAHLDELDQQSQKDPHAVAQWITAHH
jgi:hypothetical protein